jgi:hypothetical protein
VLREIRILVRQTRVLRSQSMDAAVWTAIGLLAATSLGTLFYLGSRIDALAGRMDALAGRMDNGFARVDARFDAIESRFDALGARLDAHLDRHAS